MLPRFRSVFPSDIPTKGLVLVFGEAMSGKDACVGNAITRDSIRRKFPVLVLSESQLSFGNVAEDEADPSFVSAAKIEALMDRYLVVLITQGVNNYPDCFRDFLFTHADAVCVLRSRDSVIGDFVMERTYKKWRFITAHLPDPAGYLTARETKRFAEVAVCTRRRVPGQPLAAEQWDRVVLLRLPIVRPDASPESSSRALC